MFESKDIFSRSTVNLTNNDAYQTSTDENWSPNLYSEHKTGLY